MASGILGAIVALQDREEAKKERNRRFGLEQERLELEKAQEKRLRKQGKRTLAQGERSLGIAERAENRLLSVSNRSLGLEESRLSQMANQFSEQLGFSREQFAESKRATGAGEALETRKQGFVEKVFETSQKPLDEALADMHRANADYQRALGRVAVDEDLLNMKKSLGALQVVMGTQEYQERKRKLDIFEERRNSLAPEDRAIFDDMYLGVRKAETLQDQVDVANLQINQFKAMLGLADFQLKKSETERQATMDQLGIYVGATNTMKELFGEQTMRDLIAGKIASLSGAEAQPVEGGRKEGLIQGGKPFYEMKRQPSTSGQAAPSNIAPAGSLTELLQRITQVDQTATGASNFYKME